METTLIKLVIVDDQDLIRDSLKLLIESDSRFEVVGSASNGLEALTLIEKTMPDVVLMDIRMPDLDGIECVKQIKALYDSIKMIMLTTFENNEYIYKSLKNGADGFLLKGISKSDLQNSIITVYNGGAVFDSRTTLKVISILEKMSSSSILLNDSHLHDNLSNLELKIMQLIGNGYSNKEIVDKIHLSDGTIRNYISHILKKLDLRDRTQIAIYAIQSGLMLKTIDAR